MGLELSLVSITGMDVYLGMELLGTEVMLVMDTLAMLIMDTMDIMANVKLTLMPSLMPIPFAQIHHGLPVHNAYATGHPHNVGVITGVDYGYGRVSGYGAIGHRGYAGYGYAGIGHYYG